MGPIIGGAFMLAGIEYVCIAYGFMFMLGSTVGEAETVMGGGARDMMRAGYVSVLWQMELHVLNMFMRTTHTPDNVEN